MTDPALKMLELKTARTGRAEWLREQMDGLPPVYDPTAPMEQHARYMQALSALETTLRGLPEPARITVKWNGASVTMLGITSTSTSGLAGALSNWCARVEKDQRA
ncbi:hypothetical protein BV509_00870 [Rhodovulum sulfidophilum]|uniref:Uncharacterized protein n=1 Tax=Rhodovulum visakhapatnamense TaxID=364297 RepID=A0ABS1RFW9_9RHOB|nr:hypothetical protein [Rhodovulum visakhapatnamense]MBL3569888.1 hypothetical protein [Rhodovulum visakhapatnamense]MBL3578419.1 hypothetical protein [Rhodovulum visakhapatnamense]OLS43041.1 hypothetical protein BV509_00870 [Rhodovulum sulfidophilum]